MEFKSPNENQVTEMKKFAEIVESAMQVMDKFEMNNVAMFVMKALQESVHWFNSGMLGENLIARKAIDKEPVNDPAAVNCEVH